MSTKVMKSNKSTTAGFQSVEELMAYCQTSFNNFFGPSMQLAEKALKERKDQVDKK